MPHIRYGSNDNRVASHCATLAGTVGGGVNMEKKMESDHANNYRRGVHSILSTHSSGSSVSERGDYSS